MATQARSSRPRFRETGAPPQWSSTRIRTPWGGQALFMPLWNSADLAFLASARTSQMTLSERSRNCTRYCIGRLVERKVIGGACRGTNQPIREKGADVNLQEECVNAPRAKSPRWL